VLQVGAALLKLLVNNTTVQIETKDGRKRQVPALLHSYSPSAKGGKNRYGVIEWHPQVCLCTGQTTALHVGARTTVWSEKEFLGKGVER
jgi:hypothetical protein